jgi:hypothetical protein
MGFTGNENHDIDFDDAGILTKRYRDSITPGNYIGGFFGKSAVINLLEQEDCVGVRYYYGLKEDGSPTLVLVGVDAEGNDLIGQNKSCLQLPPLCSKENVLNSSFE